ncbi:hypothetical protein [Dyella flagellata]|uniref:Secreted protein n=1 Tax=Dyella flagellata TaxID=1867833 RepID=A0ABQ5X8E1_9GAMM|nr:hypothetical protein [Dyella flagellata]GLQ86820.1 hypothetical protein GCM10007898_03860 [Dyella flagellata]
MSSFAPKYHSWLGVLMFTALSVFGMQANPAKAADQIGSQPQLRTVASLTESARPAGVPENYVITPQGYFPLACVHHLQPGEKLRRNGGIETVDGSLRSVAPCTRPHYTRDGTRIDPDGKVTRRAGFASLKRRDGQAVNGWVDDANYESDIAIGNITSYWVVPQAPSNPGNAINFFFNGLEQSNTNPNATILQPVLDWGNFGQGWHMTNWNCCLNGVSYYNGPFNVNTGDTIEGIVASTCSQDPCDNNSATITSIDLNTGQSLAYQTDAYNPLHWVFGGVLEAYNISQCSQFPASTSVDFYDISVTDIYGTTVASPPFAGEVDASSSAQQCGYQTSASPTDVTVYY